MAESTEAKLLSHILSTAFLCGVPTTRSMWQDIKTVLVNLSNQLHGEEMANLVVVSTVEHPYALQFPVDAAHELRVLEWMINIWKEYSWNGKDILNSKMPGEKNDYEVAYKTYLKGGDCKDVTLLESTEGISRGTTGLSSWGAARALSSWFIEQKSLFKSGVRILELGAGVGYNAVSILSSMDDNVKLAKYTATDYHPHVLELLLHNITIMRDSAAQNLPSRLAYETFQRLISQRIIEDELTPGSFAKWPSREGVTVGKTEVKVEQLNWCDPPILETYDVILASDITYATYLFPNLVALLKSLLTDNRHTVTTRQEKQKLDPCSPDLKKRNLLSNCELLSSESDTVNQSPDSTNNEENTEEFNFPVAYLACTRRRQETLEEFEEELQRQDLKQRIIFKTCLQRDEALFWFNETHIPIQIYEIRPKEKS